MSEPATCKRKFFQKMRLKVRLQRRRGLAILRVTGRLAQLARALRLHRRCRGFESLIAHFDARQSNTTLFRAFFVGVLLADACRYSVGFGVNVLNGVGYGVGFGTVNVIFLSAK